MGENLALDSFDLEVRLLVGEFSRMIVRKEPWAIWLRLCGASN